ncbi:MAG: ECF-type sigma factor [Fodinibius sp.]|nr:ECF-type sigma factor [Fodinibius sp.]
MLSNKKKSEITQLLNEIQDSEEAYDELFPLIYQELKRLAFSNLQNESNDITISKTELVHEVISQDD